MPIPATTQRIRTSIGSINVPPIVPPAAVAASRMGCVAGWLAGGSITGPNIAPVIAEGAVDGAVVTKSPRGSVVDARSDPIRGAKARH